MDVLSSSVTDDIDLVAHNCEAWDKLVAQDDEWPRPVGLDVIARARERLLASGAALEYSHTMTEQLGAGCILTSFVEAPHYSSITARYMPGYVATRALKPD